MSREVSPICEHNWVMHSCIRCNSIDAVLGYKPRDPEIVYREALTIIRDLYSRANRENAVEYVQRMGMVAAAALETGK